MPSPKPCYASRRAIGLPLCCVGHAYTFIDLISGPIWLGLIVIFALILRNRRYGNDPLAKFFMPALFLKLGGGVMVGIVYVFNYGGGDTVLYYQSAQTLARAFYEDVGAWVTLLQISNKAEAFQDLELYGRYGQYMVYLRDPYTYTVAKIISVPAIFGYGSYVGTSLVLAFFTFLGMWMLFRTMVDIFPKYPQQIAIGVFFLPSVFFWGSGVLKDSITLAMLGALTYCLYNVFLKGRNVIILSAIGFFCAYFIFHIKEYILYSFIPLALFWVGMTYLHRIGSPLARTAFGPFVLAIFIFSGFQLTTVISSESDRYAINKVFDTASLVSKDLASEYYYSGGTGSKYNIGQFDPSPLGLLTSFPVAISYTFFRPFLWEYINPIVYLASIESAFVMFIFIQAIRRSGLRDFFSTIFGHPFLLFAFVYSLFFAYMVGMTSGNYGNLVRYKIPCMPFFMTSVLVAAEIIRDRRAQEAQAAPPPRPTLRAARARYEAPSAASARARLSR